MTKSTEFVILVDEHDQSVGKEELLISDTDNIRSEKSAGFTPTSFKQKII